MSQANPITAAASLAYRTYRIVLFGMPDAGKSSLLGALVQAAQTQEHILGGKLIDKSHGLMELQRRLYEDRPRETLEEVAPYPIALEPLGAKDGQPPSPATEAVLFDCDGRIANELLARKDSLSGEIGRRTLAQAVLNADTLVLTIDVAAEGSQLKQHFAQFTRFLRMLERSRGQRTEVGGLPVYLVLTKCDLLARPTDTSAQWMEQIEEHKRDVHQRFQEFLARQAAQEQMPFGKIDLHVWATAVKRPALADAPARPKEPYGVAELFRQCLDSARAFRLRRRRATQRLGWVVGLLAVLIGFMTLLALFFMATRRETGISRYEKELRAFRSAHSDGPAERLQEPLERTIQDLRHFRDSPLFAKMPEDLQKYVVDHLKEAEAYQKYTRDFKAYQDREIRRQSPRFAETEGELAKMEQALEKFPVPAEYRAAWQDTDVVRREREWRQDIEVMRREVSVAVKQLDDMIAKAQQREKEDSLTRRKKLLEDLQWQEKRSPYREGNRTLVPQSTRVTYADVMRFDPVSRRYEEWKRWREKLKQDAP